MKLIINADDYGMSDGVNDAVNKLMSKGIVKSTTVMTNMPHASDARHLLAFDGVSVGLHFNLSQGQAISSVDEVKTLVDDAGRFLGIAELRNRFAKGLISKKEVYLELEAQWRRLEDILGCPPSHIDSHQGLNRIPLVFQQLLKFLSKKQNIGVRSYVKHYIQIDPEGFAKIKSPSLLGPYGFSLKRLLVEDYLRVQRARAARFAKTPSGMLMDRSHDTLDLLYKLVSVKTSFASKVCLELPCHPSASVFGLPESKYQNARIKEYELMMSDEFANVLTYFDNLSYREI